jgi:hypothetical protein
VTGQDDFPDRATRTLIASLGEPEQHLDFEAHLAPYADGTLDPAEREIVESHVEDCALCRDELDDLLLHARGTAAARPTRWRSMAVAASLAAAVTATVVWTARHSARDHTPPTLTAPPVTSGPVRPTERIAYANPEWTQLVEQSLSTARLPAPAIPLPASGSDEILRGVASDGSSNPGKLEPSGVVVETTRPTLTWPATGGATYAITVLTGREEIARGGPLTEPRWTVDRDLPRGRTYFWQVEVSKGPAKSLLPALPTPPPAFRVLGPREHEDLVLARNRHPNDALLLAVLCARYGLIAESRRYLQQVEPSDDPRVRQLVRQTQ